MAIDSQAVKPRAEDGCREVLLETAEPEMYRQNAFRVLGVSTGSSYRSISRRKRRDQILEKYGGGDSQSAAGNGRMLPLQPGPDDTEIDTARQRLRDPQRRIVDELFWIWPRDPNNGSDDEAIRALQRGDVKKAAEIWATWQKQDDQAGVAAHNLAVLYHLLALDWEVWAADGKMGEDDAKRLNSRWKRSFANWREVLARDSFWQRYAQRLHQLDDPRVPPGAAYEIREALPEALLLINATLALRAARDRRRNRAKFHAWLTHKAGWDGAAERALGTVSRPIRERIESLCEDGERNKDNDPETADQTCEAFLTEAKPLLSSLECMFPEGHAVPEMMHDKVATTALHMQVQFGAETDDWARSEELLKMALPLARGATARQRIEKNLEIVRSNKQHADRTSTCWFCGKPAVPSAMYELAMYGDVVRVPVWNGVQLHYKSGNISVPRCSDCKAAHEAGNAACGLGCGGAIAGGILGALLNGVASVPEAAPVVGAIAGGIIVTTVAAIRAKTRSGGKGVKHALKYPTVKELLDQGWSVGEKPTE